MVERGHTQFVEPSIKFLTRFNVPQEQLATYHTPFASTVARFGHKFEHNMV